MKVQRLQFKNVGNGMKVSKKPIETTMGKLLVWRQGTFVKITGLRDVVIWEATFPNYAQAMRGIKKRLSELGAEFEPLSRRKKKVTIP